jgi:hypothetical protein
MKLPQWIGRLLPFAVSAGLLALVVWWVSPQALLDAASELRWQLLLPLTAAMVVTLYLCDAVSLPIVYRVESQQFGFLQALHVRGLSYLGGAFNYELGQAGIAWGMARLQQTSLLRMLSRSVVLAYHDAVVLLTMGLVGSLLTSDERVTRIRPIIAIALVLTLLVGIVLWNLPAKLRTRIAASKLGTILADWNLGRTLRLVPLRCLYFGILVIYAAIALQICEIPIDGEVVLSTVPLVLLAEGLPNFAGLGTREASLLMLLNPPDKAVLLAMSLFWSAGMILFRLLIGLAHLWYHSLRSARLESKNL